MADDDLLPPAPAPTPAPAPEPPASGHIRCGYCRSEITRTKGEIISLSDRAKQLRDFEDDLEDAKKDLAEARTQIEELNRIIGEHENTIRALNKQLAAASKFW